MQTLEEISRARAIQIVDMAERDSPGYPTDERECWSTPNTVTTYGRLKDRASIYAELDKESPLTRDEKIELLRKVLFEMFSAIGQGKAIICNRYDISPEEADSQCTRPLYLNAYLLEQYEDINEVNKRYLLFYTLALNEILFFEEIFRKAFVQPEDWDNSEKKEASYQNKITAMGNLMVAQEAFEIGERYMAHAMSRGKIDELSEKIKTADEGRITGGYNSNKRLDKLRDWVKKESDDYFENDKDKKLKSGWIGEQLRDHVKQNIGKFELNGPIPAQKWFRDEVAKNAPPYANTRGRPKK